MAIEDGARELDMVMNIGKFLSGDDVYVQRDIEAVVAEARRHPGVLVKVILETCHLTQEQIAKACQLAQAAGADFVKTSTGYGDDGATPEAVAVMIRTVGGSMGIKPSGGIRTYEAACRYLDMGVQRLGVAATKDVLRMLLRLAIKWLSPSRARTFADSRRGLARQGDCAIIGNLG